jgi:hypothetical protein
MPDLDIMVVMVADIPVVVDIMVLVVGIMEMDMELGGTVAVMAVGMACMVVEDMVAVTLAACMVEAMGALLPVGITIMVLGVWDPGSQGTRMSQRHRLPGKRC